ncbi:PLC-like phosphodiesterase [Clavulina sp. PMI_390]|nr:PLC-like phosphodiesterase [Clavulina sp. PMI_390]
MASSPPANASASTSTPTPTPPATSASDPFLVTSPTSIVPPSSDALPNPSSSDTFPTASTTGTTNTTEAVEDILDTRVPSILQEGTEMIKVSAKQAKRRMFCLHADVGQIHWPSKKTGVLMIDNIKEIRTGPETQLHRDQLRIQLPADANRDFWITIIYTTEAKYKTLHMIAYSAGEFELWSSTLRRLFAFRRYLLNGLVGPSHRDEMWQKRYWKDTDQSGDQRADFPEIERLCRRLNISSSRANLLNVFTEADSQSKGWLSFPDFKHFVRLLKARPDIDMLFEMLQGEEHDHFSFHVFEHFMQTCQHSTHSRAQLIKTFNKFAPREEEGSRPNRDVVPGPASARTTLDEETVATNSEMGSQTDPVPSPNAWTLASFTAFLLSSDNSPYSLTDSGFTHDMTRPLSEYFISSSHNTYLVGHQLVGDSTVEGYIRALLQGCRSVEIDIWDGDDAPVICHGRTLTTKVSLTDVARAIARYAFVASPYPLIISAEIHCSVKQQDMAAEIMKREFGDMLITKTLDGADTIDVLPSPEMLKGRILLKAKNLYASQDGQIQTYMPTLHSESSSAEDDDAESSEFDAIKRGSDSKAAAATTNNTLAPPALFPDSSASHSMSRSSSQDKSRSRAASSSSQNGGKPKMSMALAELIVYTVGVKCRGFNKKEHYAVEHLFSLSERTANKILKESSGDLVKHNRTHLVRIYPNGMRLNSSNYEPHRYWACGSQLVAINWQTLDLGYVMNHAMFQRNGRAGYVLKPDALRIKDKEFIKKRTKHFLDITIISAQQLPRPDLVFGKEADTRHTIDPYVEVSLHVPDWSTSPFLPSTPQAAPAPALPNASPSSSTSSLAPVSPAGSSASPARTISATTQVVKNNGWNPTWNSQMHIPFDCVGEMMDLIFVRLQVKDQHNDAEIALFCAPLGSLRPGFRHLPLHDKQLSQFLFSTLFVQIGVRDVTNANP